MEEEDNVITIAFAAVDGRQQENKERLQKDIFGRRRLDKMAKMFSMEDWGKTTIEEIRERWAKRRIELERIEKKTEREKKIDELKKKKEESDKREKMYCLWNIWAYGPLL